MKKILIVSTLILSCISISAQPPQGGQNGMGPGHGGGRPPMEGEIPRRGGEETSIGIMKMPEIPELTIKQREKLSKALTEEEKTITQLMDEKHELMKPSGDKTTKPTEKEIEKQTKKIVNIDKKIEKAKAKSDKKIKSVLTTEQYNIFMAKRDEVEFRKPRRMGNKPPMGDRNQMPTDDHREPPISIEE